MKLRTSGILIISGLVLAAPFVGSVSAAGQSETAASRTEAATGELVKPTDKEAAWLAKARKEYPLTVCLTSDEKLGSMGESAEFIYRVKGAPDRLVMFCCEGCQDDFVKEPAKYLAKLDAAAKAKKEGASKPADKSGSGAHHH